MFTPIPSHLQRRDTSIRDAYGRSAVGARKRTNVKETENYQKRHGCAVPLQEAVSHRERENAPPV